jgi:type II secretory pathway component PulF
VSLAYPIALLAILFALLGFMNLAIVPKFTRIFEDFGTELPWLTRFVTGASNSLLYYWPAWLAALLGIPLAVYAAVRTFGGPGGPQGVWRSIPIVGQGFRWASLSNFCQLLATLMELEVPLPQAIRAAADMNDDYSLGQRAHQAALAIEKGQSPRQAVSQPGHWLSELGAAFYWADRGGDFVESLRASGEVFNARSRVQTNLLMYLFEPVVLVTLAVTVGAIILALFMPLIKLLNDLS